MRTYQSWSGLAHCKALDVLLDLGSLPDQAKSEACGAMQNAEGKQLMLEAIALLGALLLALDRQIPGAVRERIVVAYYRLRGGAQVNQQ